MELEPNSSPRAPHYLQNGGYLTPHLANGRKAANGLSFAAALFDFDGTIVDSEAPCAAAFADVVNSLGAEIGDREAAAICYGRSWHDAYADVAKMFPALNGQLDVFSETVRETIEQAGGFLGDPIPSSLSALKQVAQRMPVAVVSGSFRANLVTSLERLGVAQYVTTVVGDEDYSDGKPSPEPFLVGAKSLGFSPHRCVVFEDSDAGIQAARAAGIRCIALRPGATASQACISVDRLDASAVWRFLSEPESVKAT